MKLSEISFPVFQISSSVPITNIGSVAKVTYISRDEDIREKVIDDKSLPGTTLGMRRLQLKAAGALLYPLKDAIYFLGDMIKLAKKPSKFIDNTGKIFEYRKHKRVPLVFKKISAILPIPTGGSIIVVDGMIQRFKTLGTTSLENKYVGLLELGMGHYILYGVFKNKEKDTWRKV